MPRKQPQISRPAYEHPSALCTIKSLLEMNIRIVVALLFCFYKTFAFGQNLIPNSSFELYTTCPTKFGQFHRLQSWITPTVYQNLGGTPDLFNECSTLASQVTVPNNFTGFQYSNTGQGYCGLLVFTDSLIGPDYREYIEVPLTETLLENECYHFEMYLNLSNLSNVTTDAFGVYFSDTVIMGINNHYPFPFVPQIQNTNGFITDTLNWVLFESDYNAIGGEKYLIIGNFNNDINSNHIPALGCCNNFAYFYIDDVSLAPCSLNQIIESNTINKINIYPNPTFQNAILKFKNPLNENYTLIIYNTIGHVERVMFNLNENKIEIERGSLSSGVYYLQLRTDKRIIGITKVILL